MAYFCVLTSGTYLQHIYVYEAAIMSQCIRLEIQNIRVNGVDSSLDRTLQHYEPLFCKRVS